MLAQAELKGFYVPLDNPAPKTAMKGAQLLGFHGLNVTVPHKLAALKNSHKASDTARLIGAANTLCLTEDGYEAHNTDGEGLLLALREEFGKKSPNQAALLGAGGAARGVLWALANWGVKEIAVYNRTLKTAKALAPLAKTLGLKFEVLPLAESTHFPQALVIQSTSLGMFPNQKQIPTQPTFQNGAWVMDLIYRPRTTAFLAAAAAQGCKTVDGLPMLVNQAALAFSLWTGKKPDRKALLVFAQKNLTRNRAKTSQRRGLKQEIERVSPKKP